MGRVRRDRRASQADASVHALKAVTPEDIAEAKIGQWVPPSTTVIRTQYDGWYYIPDSFDDALELIDMAEDWIVFPVVGNEATKIMLRKDNITAVIDLTQNTAVVEDAEVDDANTP